MRVKRALGASLCLVSLIVVPQRVAVAQPGGPVTTNAGYLASAMKDVTMQAGFADALTRIRVDEAAQRVIVHTAEADLAAKVVEIAKAKSGKDVGVDIRKSKYRLSELHAARDEIIATTKSLEASGVDLAGVGLDAEGDGLVLKVNDTGNAKQALATTSSFGAVSSVDVEFVQGARPKNMTRENDTPPYAGGIKLDNFLYRCTSAFAIWQGSAEFLITAEHCFGVNDMVFNGTTRLGRIMSVNVLLDAASIPTDTWSGVYTYNAQWKNYRTAQWTYHGQNVCQSGYYTNQACDYVVTDEDMRWQDERGNWRHGVLACRTSGATGAIEGDSGGPVYSFRADGYLDSRGIVSAGGGNCMFFTETGYLLNAWGASLQVS